MSSSTPNHPWRALSFALPLLLILSWESAGSVCLVDGWFSSKPDSDSHGENENGACTGSEECPSYTETHNGFTRPRNLRANEDFEFEAGTQRSYKLGPDIGEECTIDSCPGFPGAQGFAQPEHLKHDDDLRTAEPNHHPVDENQEQSDTETEFALMKKDEKKSMLSIFSDSVSGAFSQASGYFKKKIYSKAANMTSDFTDKIREVFHEELYGFFGATAKKLGEILSPGKKNHQNNCLIKIVFLLAKNLPSLTN